MRVNGYPGTRIFTLFTFCCVMILFCLKLAESVSRKEDSDLSVFFGSQSGSFVNDVSHSKHFGRNLLDHEREDNHVEDDDSKGKEDDTQLKEDAEDTVEDVDQFLHKLQNSKAGNPGFIHALVAALSVIIVSELGDKTFFIAAILAMRYSRLTVLLGALTALFIMTILSALVGYATTIIPRYVTYYISSLLFAVFGIKMLREGWYMSPDEGQEEYEEAQAEVKKREDEIQKQNMPTQDIETGIIRTPGHQFWAGILSTVFLESLTLTFLAEWGDRSQIATIILGAREDVIGVITGGLLGHALCTGLAVVGGRFVAQRISIRTVTLIGGVVFLVFAASAFIFGPES
ncbi:transmembrane protein 165-like isoform X1 [Pomacea canaliculata]|uniref:transmembrane protein 165-like isoform X1 n=1 Tax=Pomacea canaliculata TaxID=400727 RepID=UPI000D72A7C0|nr:transmembrane protein 165-like isoform X1 [Pomacea canaliculata]